MAYMSDNAFKRLLDFISYHHGKRFTICVIGTMFIYYLFTIYDYILFRVYPYNVYLWDSHILIFIFLAWIILSGFYIRGDKRYVKE